MSRTLRYRLLPVAACLIIGAALLAVAASNTGYHACEPGQPGVAGIYGDGSTYTSCGGTNPVPFLLGGLAFLAIGGIVAVLVVRQNRT